MGQLCRGGILLVQLLVVVMLVSILATAAFTAYRESVRSANLRAAHAALLEMRALSLYPYPIGVLSVYPFTRQKFPLVQASIPPAPTKPPPGPNRQTVRPQGGI